MQIRTEIAIVRSTIIDETKVERISNDEILKESSQINDKLKVCEPENFVKQDTIEYITNETLKTEENIKINPLSVRLIPLTPMQLEPYLKVKKEQPSIGQKSIVDHNEMEIQCKNCRKCYICNKIFKKKIHLTIHLCNVHEKRIKQNYKCHKCKVHKCNFCNKVYSQSSTLREHIMSIHGGQKYKCDTCGKVYINARLLKNHHKSVHEGQNPHKCQICEKSFALKGTLENHIKSIHENIREFKCYLCPKAFNLKVNRDQHIKFIHEGVKYYKCDICVIDFSKKCHLDKHLNSKAHAKKSAAPIEHSGCACKKAPQ